jgi:hypothetical protein
MFNEIFLDAKKLYQASPIWLRKYYLGSVCFILACFFWWYIPCVSSFGFDQLSGYFGLIDQMYSPSLYMAGLASAFTVANFYLHKKVDNARILLLRKFVVAFIIVIGGYILSDYYSSWKSNKEQREETRSTVELVLKIVKKHKITNEIKLDFALIEMQMEERLGKYSESDLPSISLVDIALAPDFVFSRFDISRGDYLYLRSRSAQTVPGLALVFYFFGLLGFYSGARYTGFLVKAD